jgi:protocatechuate 3,4-dioxygenase beta subunit
VSTNSCTLIPSETAGPFPLDLTANPFYYRQDVRENRAGVQLNLRLRIMGDGNCLPMQNVRVNIWHCDKDGLYSGYNTETAFTYLRGYQMTDANGEVEFVTIFPGWYPGRICHIHFQVYVSSAYAAISQLTFDETIKNSIYTSNPGIYTNGIDPMTYNTDNVFYDGYAFQLATLTPNAATGGYDSFMEISVQGNGTTGIGHIEKENAKNFMLGQNFPNPYQGKTTIPYMLKKASDVSLELFDVNGNKVCRIEKENAGAGEHMFLLDLDALRIPDANYVYQLQVKNDAGIFTDHKMMTAFRKK